MNITKTSDGKIKLDTDKDTIVSISDYQGESKIDVRHYWKGKPTPKGISLPLDDALLLITGLIEIVNQCTDENFILVEGEELEME